MLKNNLLAFILAIFFIGYTNVGFANADGLVAVAGQTTSADELFTLAQTDPNEFTSSTVYRQFLNVIFGKKFINSQTLCFLKNNLINNLKNRNYLTEHMEDFIVRKLAEQNCNCE